MPNAKPTSWRDWLPIHPRADRLPLLPPDKLRAMADDIKKPGGLRLSAVFWRRPSDGEPELLDGRNRLDALELLGEKITLDNNLIFDEVPSDIDAVAYIVSVNIHRRHLTAEERQNLLIELIARAPAKSDRQHGKDIGVDHKTIALARAKGEDVGSIPHVESRQDTKGRQQPAKKKRRTADDFVAEKKAREKSQAQAIADRAEETARQRQHTAEQMRAAAQAVLEPEKPWSVDQAERKAQAERGQCVVANMHTGADVSLIAWAKAADRFVRIDRPTQWENPFEMPADGSREEVIANFAYHYLPYKKGLLRRLPDLRGKVLGCWCHPEDCHGHIIAGAVNQSTAGAPPAPPSAPAAADDDAVDIPPFLRRQAGGAG